MPSIIAMDFWTHILPQAMEILRKDHKEPESVKGKGFGIRERTEWEGIYTQLLKAREKYDGAPTGFRERLKTRYKTTYRKTADNSEIPSKLVEAILDQDITSPVRAILDVVFDVSLGESRMSTL
jgi:hypothetical protein